MTAPAGQPSTVKPRRLLDVLQAAAGYLAEKEVEQPRLTAELLAGHVLACKRLALYLRYDERLAETQLQALRAGVRRLGAGEPLQYVTGETDFRGRAFQVDSRVLIPRPETELLVAAVLARSALWARPRPAIADVGTGSGCIAVSLALERPDAEYLAVDIDAGALQTAGANAARHGVGARIVFLAADLLSSFAPGALDGVVANLPYVRSADCDILPRHIREHEPRRALDGGADGLDLIRRLVAQARAVLRPGGVLALEIGCDEGAAVRELLDGFTDVETRTDYSGRERLIAAARA